MNAMTRDSSPIDHFDEEDYQAGFYLAHPEPGDEVVISGISGAFPGSRDVHHLMDNLYKKKDLVTNDKSRWNLNHPEIPKHGGTLLHIDQFDPGFFSMSYLEADAMDPQLRMLLEKTVEAIIDAGVNPSELEGSKTGVFVAVCESETEIISSHYHYWACHKLVTSSFKSMLARRLSYFLKLNGPSFLCDSACSSGLHALENAFKSIRSGVCENAIVGGVHLTLNPYHTLHFARMGVLNKNGSCRAFDVDSNGYIRSEGVSSLFLQKSKDARRIYAQIIHAKTGSDGFKEEGITFPSSTAQMNLFKDVYRECNYDPSLVGYLEAHGTGTIVGDPQEMKAIDAVFCKNRTNPLLVGSVKSNLGHCEGPSALISVAKVIISFEAGLIPPNINFTAPRPGIEALEKGRVKIVTEPTPFQDNRGLVGLSSFGFGGSNGHALLCWNPKSKISGGLPKDDLPRLVCISGRVENSIDHICNSFRSRPIDTELIRLYHQIYSKEIKGHLYRGYTILSKSGELKRSSVRLSNPDGSLFFYFSNFTLSCSRAITKQLITVPSFNESIKKVVKILQSQGIDLFHLVENSDEESSFNVTILNVTVQIALIDLFKSLSLVPCGVLGCGFGQLICAYYTGTLTLEETLLCATIISSNIRNLGNNHNQISKIQNSKDLEETNNKLSQLLGTIMTKGRNEAENWLSLSRGSSISIEDLVNYKTNPAPVEDHMSLIPRGSTVFDFGNGYHNVKYCHVLTFRDLDLSNCFLGLLDTLGQLYQLGFNYRSDKLYPDVAYPVSRGTPMLAPYVKWNHDKNWRIVTESKITCTEWQRVFSIKLVEPEWSHLAGHIIDGRILFPATGYLYLVWQTMSTISNIVIDKLKIIFEDCRFLRATSLSQNSNIDLTVMIQKGTGKFEVTENQNVVVSGRVFMATTSTELTMPLSQRCSFYNGHIPMNATDIYKELGIRGYNYSGDFKQLVSHNYKDGSSAIKWNNNWITFLDNMLQARILGIDTRLLYIITAIKQLTIDPIEHLRMVTTVKEDPNTHVRVFNNMEANVLSCGGIEIRGFEAKSVSRRKQKGEPVLEKYQFVPNNAQLTVQQSIRVNMQIILENTLLVKVKVVELMDELSKENAEPLCPLICEALTDSPLIQPELIVLSKNTYDLPNVTVKDDILVIEKQCALIISSRLLQRRNILDGMLNSLIDNGYILSRESVCFRLDRPNLRNIKIITHHITENESFVLLKKASIFLSPSIINVSDTVDFSWLQILQYALKNNNRSGRAEKKEIIIYVQDEPLSGIIGLLNCIRREVGGRSVKCVQTFGSVPAFDVSDPFYKEQLEKNLAVNVYKQSQWGTYRQLLLDDNTVETEHRFVNTLVKGDLSSLTWIESPLTHSTQTKDEFGLIHVYYSALNFRDVMIASDKITVDVITRNRLKQQCNQGFEFSGKTPNGERVMGIVEAGALATLVLSDPHLLFPVPELWSLEDAATVPLVYGTVLYAFFRIVSIKPGQSILIHAGSGGIGQAAINVALFNGCEVYTTVGAPKKKEFLLKAFPQLKASNIGNSRDTSFEQLVYSRTKGRGVDYVLNSLAEEKLLASVRCLARGGHFLEIGKIDLSTNQKLNLQLLKKEGIFHGVQLDSLFNLEPMTKIEIRNLVLEHIEKGAVKPLARRVYGTCDIEEAFRYMAGGKHIGKILIKLRDEGDMCISGPIIQTWKAVPRYSCNSENVYVLIGGLGGFGLELADWLVIRGARKLILVSRRGISTGYQSYRINIWKSYGVLIRISTADVTTKSGCQELINEANAIGHVHAIFNLAVNLKDAIFENQTQESFQLSFAPKANATCHLDEITRKDCPNLRDFVVFSSVSCGRGNAGQTNYGMANSVMEEVCELRKQDGLPALAIEWGAIGDVGVVANMQKKNIQMKFGGTLQQGISSCLHVLDQLLRQDNTIVSSMVVAEKKRGPGGSYSVTEIVAKILGLKNLKSVSRHYSLAELGMDSMTALEIREVIEEKCDILLTAHDVRLLTLAKLDDLQDKSEFRQNQSIKDSKVHVNLFPVLTITEEESRNSLIRINTKLNPSFSVQVICCPGFEGVPNFIRPLLENLKCQVDCLQYAIYDYHETIPDIAKRSISIIKPNLSKKKPLCVIGHSFGASIALEIISILEKDGFTGKVVCIDGSPDLSKSIAQELFTFTHEFDTNVLSYLLTFFSPTDVVVTVKDKLNGMKTIDDKINLIVDHLTKDIPHSRPHLTQITKCLLSRAKSVRDYQPSYRIKSDVHLYKSTNVAVSGFSEDYGLARLCINGPQIKTLKGNHATILYNLELAESINALLAPGRS